MTREEASLLLHKLREGTLSVAERRRVMEEVMVAVLSLYAGEPPLPGPRILLARPQLSDRLITLNDDV